MRAYPYVVFKAPPARPDRGRSVRNEHSSEGWMMGRFLVLVGATVGGGVGWWLGERFGTMTAFIISTIGTALGVYAARRLTNELLL